MKIIQTFWTAGQDPLKHGFGWTHPEYNLMSWALSCLSLKEHYSFPITMSRFWLRIKKKHFFLAVGKNSPYKSSCSRCYQIICIDR